MSDDGRDHIQWTKYGGFRADHGLPKRKRDQDYCDAFMAELQHHDVRGARLAAGRRLGWHWSGEGWVKPMTDIQILRKAKKIEQREGSLAYMRSMFEAVGFSPVDGVRTLVDHIKGNITKETIVDGEVTEVKLPPNLDALKHYHKLTLQEQTKKIEVDTRSIVAHKMMSDTPPAMRARVLKDALPGGKD
jgi:hypothetical protein